MSAKQFYGAKTYQASVLPNEIWAEIFRWATWVDGFPNVYLGSWEMRSFHERALQKALRASLVTKRYIVRVCHQWYNLALPYLYEYILLGRERTLEPLLAALKSSATRKDQSYGWWTKRLDVLLRDNVLEGPQVAHDLSEIMQELPNLETWNLFIPYHYESDSTLYRDVFQKAKRCGHSLRIVNMWTPVSLEPGVWEGFLSQHPNIQYLTSNPGDPFPLPNMPNLACIWNPGSYQVDQPSRYPNLHTVILEIRLDQDIHLQGPLDQISHLQLLIPFYGFSFPLQLATLKRVFTSLKRLDLAFTTIDQNFPAESCPFATEIGFRCKSELSKRDTCAFFTQGIPNLVKAIPILKLVQFTDEVNVVALSRFAQRIREPLASLQEGRIQVVDCEGRRLTL